jgi:DNA-binding PadR family transcriptional regulator
MRKFKPPTELEGTVLGVVWHEGPTTAYKIRRVFMDSPSPYWSGSAGAIYPLVARLEAAGLLKSEPHATGSRRASHYRVTPKGRAALVAWLGDPENDLVAGVPPDPLRTRLPFLEVLPAAERRAYLERVAASMSVHLERSREKLRATRHEVNLDVMVTEGAIAMLEARLKWIKRVRNRV